ncbi:DNA-3-methyladenine glycosylase I [Psychroflexus sp. ALD_RP9]|uniref:DNA-3-methyladenine glycosylase I n=1 Tax=Psychroflexus sp. ALD_RP9 TaxID=2777186 RepID=UPI001A8EE603|nr:DNA-3-methyladenine glycosylase I [Psychroflexus sp. ALD_RP9]QSS96067.1 DNA-3-methyladenine glycosylase I [Psychroflexus sp. ALD_RP9]
MTKLAKLNRCDWCLTNSLYINYHDNEWGKACFDDQELFEKLSLECFQSGLNWLTILKKRNNFRVAFDLFDIQKIANYDSAKVEDLLHNKGIVRHRGKIEATINNARACLLIKAEYKSLSHYFWSYVNHQPIVNDVPNIKTIPSPSQLSKRISKDLKVRGFKFLGPTTVYAFLQSCGIINDHLNACFKK